MNRFSQIINSIFLILNRIFLILDKALCDPPNPIALILIGYALGLVPSLCWMWASHPVLPDPFGPLAAITQEASRAPR